MSHSTHGGFNCPPEARSYGCPLLWRAAPLSVSARAFPHFWYPASFQSFAVGVGKNFTQRSSETALFVPALSTPVVLRRSIWSEAVGVGTLWLGNKPKPVPYVRGANVGCWYAVPIRIIPERGQGSENGIQSSMKQRRDVLHDDEAGSKLANEAGIFKPKARTLASHSGAFPGAADVLAGEPSADDIDGNSIGSELCSGEFANIGVAGDIGPVLCEDAAGELFDFTECDGLETACAFEAKAKPSYTAKEIEDAQLVHSPAPIIRSANEPQGHEPEDGARLDRCELVAGHTRNPTVSAQRLIKTCARPSPREQTFGGKALCVAEPFTSRIFPRCVSTLPGQPSNIRPGVRPTGDGIRERFGEGSSNARSDGSTNGKPLTGARLSLWGSGERIRLPPFPPTRLLEWLLPSRAQYEQPARAKASGRHSTRGGSCCGHSRSGGPSRLAKPWPLSAKLAVVGVLPC